MNKTPDPVIEMGVEYLKLALVVSLTLSTIAVGGAYALKALKPCSVCRHRYALCRQFEDTTGHRRCGMSLLISGDLRLATDLHPPVRYAWLHRCEIEASRWLMALELHTAWQCNIFVSCKADGIWPAIKASCCWLVR
jgi:hypothetical protein